MTCTKCNNHFCWICGQAIARNDVARHFGPGGCNQHDDPRDNLGMHEGLRALFGGRARPVDAARVREGVEINRLRLGQVMYRPRERQIEEYRARERADRARPFFERAPGEEQQRRRDLFRQDPRFD